MIRNLPVIIPLRPETDFEKLMFCESYIRELKRLAGADQALIDELTDRIRTLERITPEQKRDQYCADLIGKIREQAIEIARLNKLVKRLNSELVIEKLK